MSNKKAIAHSVDYEKAGISLLMIMFLIGSAGLMITLVIQYFFL